VRNDVGMRRHVRTIAMVVVVAMLVLVAAALLGG
jgi:hypothetical protein